MKPAFRIGHGFDVHEFCPGDHVMLGGVRIEHQQGIRAHSDGDVILHALADAMLGALALGDIGKHFPDTDPQYKDMNSLKLLAEVNTLVKSKGYCVGNIDVTLVAQAPKVAAHIAAMRVAIASALACEEGVVSVKATTTEGLGYVGRKEGVAAHAVVLLAAG